MQKNKLPGRKLFEMSEEEIYNYFNQFPPNLFWPTEQSFSDTFLLSGTNIKRQHIRKKSCIDYAFMVFISTVSVTLFNGFNYITLVFDRTDSKLKKIYAYKYGKYLKIENI